MKEMTIIPPTTTTAIAKIEDAPIDNEVLAIASQRADFKENYLVSILKNKNRVIRNLPKAEVTDLYLLNEVKKIAAAYGGDNDLSSVIQRECVKALHGEFASLSIAEVWLAFRLHSTGEMEDTKRGEMYGGKMTAKSFIAVLASWKKYKAKAVMAYVQELDAKQQAKEEEIRAEKMKKDFWPNVAAKIVRLRENKTDWRDCPVYLFETLRDRGLIPGLEDSEVWKPIWEDALELARIDYFKDKESNITTRGQVRLIGEVARLADEEGIEDKRKAIAKKLALFRLVIINKDFSLESVTNQLPL